MKRKTSAQIRRMEKRAEARGDVYTYVPPPPTEKSKEQKRVEVAKRLAKELKQIENNTAEELSAKDRRSAKRKAEAVAAEDAGMSRVEFLEWCETFKPLDKKGKKPKVETKKVPSASAPEDPTSSIDGPKLQAAEKLLSELEGIDQNADLNSKDRRSAKRKAHSIATEATEMDSEKLLEWYQQNKNLD